MKKIICLLLLVATSAYGQNTFKAKIVDGESKEPLPGATAQINSTQGAIANPEGLVEISGISGNSVTVKFSFVGYETQERTFSLPQSEIPIIEMEHHEEMESVVITSTRSSRTIDEIPTRIEAINSEEMEEKAMMRSSNIAMVLRESTGILMQQTSASSANQSIRIQGLDGRYTQILKDGFPLFGGFSSGLSIMQIPPLDLKQVEIVKGSNSTLFGGGAIAGLINLVSITPEEERKLKFMIDQTEAGGTTFNTFYAQRFDKFGLTFYTSANRQQAYDPNGDDFSDIPQIRNLTINPSLFYYFNDNSKLRFTINSNFENRLGGDIQVIEDGSTSGIHQFTEENKTNRLSYQLTYNNQLTENRSLNIKSSLTYFDRQITEPGFQFMGEQWSSFSEVSYNIENDGESWIMGMNLYTDKFRENPMMGLARDYDYTTLGAFTQNTTQLYNKWWLETGLRFDYDFDYGFFALPRISLLTKINQKWSARLGGGLGYKLPTIFTEEAENLTYQGILPINPNEMEAEESVGGNFDVNYKTAIGSDWTFSLNQLFFYTRLNNSLVFRESNPGEFFYENADGAVTSQGIETNLKLTYKDFKFFANYALIDTRLQYDNLNNQKPLTPKHNIGAVLMYEQHGKWRVGLESYYTGRQFKNDGSQTDDFWIVGLMVMRKWNKLALYVNFENFTDTRQHRLESFDVNDHFKPQFPELWAPTDGKIINGGIILEF